MESDVNKKEKAEADKLFHYEIARASGNSLILSILNSASLLIESLIEDVRAKIFAYEGNDAAINAQHRCIVPGPGRRQPPKKPSTACRPTST